MMHDPQQSEASIVAMKPTNKTDGTVAEPVERRDVAEGNTEELNTCRTQRRVSVSQRLQGVRERAKKWKKERFTALLHHVDVDLLRESFYRLKRDAAPGVDRQSWAQYGERLEANLADLHGRIHRGCYHPLPTRRVHIPKESGGTRPLGVTALEDKIVQRALAEVLSAIYEVDFRGFSYGFRVGRSQHDALDALATAIKRTKLGWIVDLDIEKFFDQPSQCPPQEPTFLSKVSSLSLPALSFRSAASVAGLSGKRYNFVRASRASAMVPLWIRS